ncbi:MAG: YggS family pyridoxal phosphate-dependent enzyme [Anaerostipes sp.]|jgi:pyridoxal phosphate enzyme (YggS family)|nr:YggS family pyridoxal phosphate-dependent enzyme [Anaerostipes sp.]
MLVERYEQVEENVKKACQKVNRSADEITIIAVSKTKPLSMVEELRNHGVMEYGENKVQEITRKFEEVSKPVHWHLIGHLQTNKVKYIVDKVVMIHSVDSLKLAKQISKEAQKKGVQVPVLLQVNLAHEDSKFGMSKEELLENIQEIGQLEGIQVKGLMQIAPYVQNPEDNRSYFKEMKQLSIDIEGKNFDNVSMSVLSMGMTNDYQVAIEEGATMIRVGTGIFGERDYSK